MKILYQYFKITLFASRIAVIIMREIEDQRINSADDIFDSARPSGSAMYSRYDCARFYDFTSVSIRLTSMQRIYYRTTLTALIILSLVK